jgi:Zn-dependent protease with chaperone function
MDFFARQEAARKRTAWLVLLFGLAVACIIVAVYAAINGLLYLRGEPPLRPGLWNPELFAVVCIAVLAVVFFSSMFKISALRGGGSVVAESLGAQRVPTDTRVFEERRLLNVVEEMAIASGVPVPPVYVLDDQKSINAFAAGYTPDDAVVAVTRGALLALDRDELQGVIAHEFSHILNGDMRLNIRLMGVLFGILVLALIGRSTLRMMRFGGRGRDSKGGGAMAVILVVSVTLLIVGSIGVFFGKLIKSAVSRQREFLADASAVQFSRNPQGIAGALKKIGGLAAGSRIQHPRAEEASHMYFGDGLAASWFGLFATHPPLADRVRRIDPSFDGAFPSYQLPAAGPRRRREPGEQGEREAGEPSWERGAWGITGALLAAAIDPQRLLLQIGRPMLEHAETVRRLLDTVPAELRDAAHDPYGARAVVYALLLDRRPPERERQMGALREQADPHVVKMVHEVAALVDPLAIELKIALVDITVYALRNLTESQYRGFRACVDALIEADRTIDLFEFTLVRLFVRHLDGFFGPVNQDRIRVRALDDVADEVRCVLSVLARAGQEDESAAGEAFAAAAGTLGQKLGRRLLPRERCDLQALDRALKRLASASPDLKRRIVGACLVTLVHDQRIHPREALLFRAVSDGLGVPVPPALQVVARPPGATLGTKPATDRS